ncbi:MAG: DEAD/DEAH box helicase, partial [Bacteroidia bacterium]|nr:DEAD/DEAH box helicase [Bacteroidia bacterium]
LKKMHAEMIYDSDAPKLFLIERDMESESRACDFFAGLRKDEAQLFDFGLNADKAFAWMEQNYPLLTSKGVELSQEFEGEKFCFDRPLLSAEAEKNDFGYVVTAGISVGGAWVPLPKIKKNVLNSDQKLLINNERAALLPRSWLENLRLLFEIADEDEQGRLHVRLCHAGVIRSAFQGIKIKGFLLSDAFEEIKPVEIPKNFHAQLREYQKAGYDWLCFLREFGLNGILADDMGLGKTVQTLALLQKVKEVGTQFPHLIVAPNSLIFNWIAEIKRFTPELKVLEHVGPKRDKTLKNRNQYDIIVTTYGVVRQDEEYLSECRFDYIILDECQYIKNSDAKTTQAIFKLNSKSRLALTGTPIENSTMDLWTQVHFLNPGMLGTSYFFEQYYAIPIEKHNSSQRREELRAAVYPIILRRTKEMVAKDLPEKVVNHIYSEMTIEQKKLYKETTALYRSTLFGKDSDIQKNKVQILAGLQRLRQIAIHPQMIDPTKKDSGKYVAIREILWQLLSSGEKVLVFSHFVKFLTILRYDLIKERIKFGFLSGDTKDRESEVRRFQTDDQTNVFLVSLKAGGVGLNLTAARYVLLVDPWWNPAVEMQAISRAHRIGQDRSVFVYKFISKDSIEEKILKLQQHKSKLAEEVVKSESGFFKALDKNDLIDLFD